MGEYVDVAGHRTWMHKSGNGEQTILLLHGGMSCSEDLLGALGEPLASTYSLVAFDRIGHGYTADNAEPFHYESMADEVVAVIELIGGPVHLLGWSDGGIAALLASRRRPDLVRRQVLIGTNFHYDGIILDGVDEGEEAVGGMAEAYARRSPDGADHFPVVLDKFLRMAETEPTLDVDDLAGIGTPTLVLAGDDDMVRLDHTVALYEGLPQGQLAIVPGASHSVPMEKPELVSRLVLDFLAAPVPPATMLPVRRSGAAHSGGR